MAGIDKNDLFILYLIFRIDISFMDSDGTKHK